MIESDTVLEKEGWQLDKIINIVEDESEEWWVLRKDVGGGTRTSMPFDSVYVTGGLIVLRRKGESTSIIKGALTGGNEYAPDTDIPIVIVEKLKEIGPW